MTVRQRSEPLAPLRELGGALASVADALLDHGISLEEAVNVFVAGYVRSAVDRHDGNLSQAAAALGIHRNTLRSKLQRNGPPPRRSPK